MHGPYFVLRHEHGSTRSGKAVWHVHVHSTGSDPGGHVLM